MCGQRLNRDSPFSEPLARGCVDTQADEKKHLAHSFFLILVSFSFREKEQKHSFQGTCEIIVLQLKKDFPPAETLCFFLFFLWRLKGSG